MPAIDRILTSSLIDMGEPEYPTRRELIDVFYRVGQYYVNTLRLTDDGWFLKTFQFAINGSSDRYPIPAPDFSGSYLVTTDPTRYADGRRRIIETSRITNFNEYTRVPDKVIQGTVTPDSIGTLAFVCINGQWNAMPKPSNAIGFLVIWYEPGYVGEPNEENMSPLQQQFWPLLAVATARRGIENARWQGMSPEDCAAKRAELRPGLDTEEARYLQQFKTYIRSVNQMTSSFRKPFETSPNAANTYGGGFRRGPY